MAELNPQDRNLTEAQKTELDFFREVREASQGSDSNKAIPGGQVYVVALTEEELDLVSRCRDAQEISSTLVQLGYKISKEERPGYVFLHGRGARTALLTNNTVFYPRGGLSVAQQVAQFGEFTADFYRSSPRLVVSGPEGYNSLSAIVDETFKDVKGWDVLRIQKQQ